VTYKNDPSPSEQERDSSEKPKSVTIEVLRLLGEAAMLNESHAPVLS
jgi:hypothetical protein